MGRLKYHNMVFYIDRSDNHVLRISGLPIRITIIWEGLNTIIRGVEDGLARYCRV
jgi:hypothetical protein